MVSSASCVCLHRSDSHFLPDSPRHIFALFIPFPSHATSHAHWFLAIKNKISVIHILRLALRLPSEQRFNNTGLLLTHAGSPSYNSRFKHTFPWTNFTHPTSPCFCTDRSTFVSLSWKYFFFCYIVIIYCMSWCVIYHYIILIHHISLYCYTLYVTRTGLILHNTYH